MFPLAAESCTLAKPLASLLVTAALAVFFISAFLAEDRLGKLVNWNLLEWWGTQWWGLGAIKWLKDPKYRSLVMLNYASIAAIIVTILIFIVVSSLC